MKADTKNIRRVELSLKTTKYHGNGKWDLKFVPILDARRPSRTKVIMIPVTVTFEWKISRFLVHIAHCTVVENDT